MTTYTLKNRVGILSTFTGNEINDHTPLPTVFEDDKAIKQYIRNLEYSKQYEDIRRGIETLYTIAYKQRQQFVIDNAISVFKTEDDGPYFMDLRQYDQYCLLDNFETILSDLANEFYIPKNKD